MNELIVRLARMLIYTGRPWLSHKLSKLVWDDAGRLENYTAIVPEWRRDGTVRKRMTSFSVYNLW
jgi:hypothetical protein